MSQYPDGQSGRLLARPGGPAPAGAAPAVGLHPLELGEGRDGLLYLPQGYQAETPAPLAVMLHGAGGSAHHALQPFLHHADVVGVILLAPSSRGRTWDLILGGYGADVAWLDRALDEAFGRYAVDARHLAVGGFSDGASYALSLGITNGDLFTHLIAFSPGFSAPAAQHGAPRVFVSHGTEDRVLPVAACGRSTVRRLERAGYDVRYDEFEGGHTVPAPVAEEALRWFLADT